eukprot:gene5413-3900_t
MDIVTETEHRIRVPFITQLLRRKSLLQVSQTLEQNELSRSLGLMSLVSMGIGAVVGAGVFVITGQAAALYAGPALSISFFLCIFPCAFTGLCYAELSAMVPVAGSAYTHTALALGEVAGFIVAVCLTLENLVSGSAVAVSWSASIMTLLSEFGIHIPPTLGQSPIGIRDGSLYLTGAFLNVPAVFICVVATIVLCVGISESATVNTTFVFIKLGVLLVFVLYGILLATTHTKEFAENLTPFIPPNEGQFGRYGWSGICRGAGIVFFANVGFDTICGAAQECTNPQRDLPRSLILILLCCTGIYMTVTIVLTGMMNYKELNVADPVLVALAHAGAPRLVRWCVDLGAVAGLTSVCIMSFLTMPRLLMTVANDGLMPPRLGVVSRRWRTPVNATIASGVVGACVAGFFPLEILGEIISFGTLVAFSCVCVSLIRCRAMYPAYPRPFRTPFYPVVPILGVAFNVMQLLMLPFTTWRNYFIVLFLALLWYLLYSRHHSFLCVSGDVGTVETDHAVDLEDTRIVELESILPSGPSSRRLSLQTGGMEVQALDVTTPLKKELNTLLSRTVIFTDRKKLKEDPSMAHLTPRKKERRCFSLPAPDTLSRSYSSVQRPPSSFHGSQRAKRSLCYTNDFSENFSVLFFASLFFFHLLARVYASEGNQRHHGPFFLFVCRRFCCRSNLRRLVAPLSLRGEEELNLYKQKSRTSTLHMIQG